LEKLWKWGFVSLPSISLGEREKGKRKTQQWGPKDFCFLGLVSLSCRGTWGFVQGASEGFVYLMDTRTLEKFQASLEKKVTQTLSPKEYKAGYGGSFL
jgi:hypothetical protein